MALRQLASVLAPQSQPRLARAARVALASTHTLSSGASEHKVVCDGRTLYIDQELAEALGWRPEHGVDGLKLSLHGWAPHYFAITPHGTDNERLASGTVESSQNPSVRVVLDYLKDR